MSQPNILDSLPFFELDFENIESSDIEILQRFSKESFDVASLVSYAEELVYYSKMKPEIIDLLRNPSDELTRLLIKKHVSDVKLTFSVIERYRPIVKNAITDALLEMFRQGIVQQPVKSDIDLHEEINVNTEECEQGPGKKELPKMGKLFERGLIRAGEVVYLKNHPQEKAKVINEKAVSYKSEILSFNQWGQQVTGWKSINIYDWVIVEGQTETLSVLRRNMLLEQKSKLI